MTHLPDYRPGLQAMVQEHRRSMAAASPQAFAHIYLGHHFSGEGSRMHRELFEMLVEATDQRRRRIAIAAPRGHAKTTVVSVAYVLWCVLYRRERFVLLISSTREQAVQLLKTVKDELQSNTLLIADFPQACYPSKGSGSGGSGSASASGVGVGRVPKPWRDNQIALRNGVAVRALGANQACGE